MFFLSITINQRRIRSVGKARSTTTKENKSNAQKQKLHTEGPEELQQGQPGPEPDKPGNSQVVPEEGDEGQCEVPLPDHPTALDIISMLDARVGAGNPNYPYSPGKIEFQLHYIYLCLIITMHDSAHCLP